MYQRRLKDVSVVTADHVDRLETQQPFGAWIDCGHDAVRIESDHAGRDISKQGFRVTPPMLEFRRGGPQVGGHLVERSDQPPNLVVAVLGN